MNIYRNNIKIISATLGLLILLLGTGICDANAGQFELIQGALSRLLERPNGAFVIVEEAMSAKFVQFSGSSSESIVLDLPKQTLSDEEYAKTEALFKAHGLTGPDSYELYEYEGGPPVAIQISFTVDFGKDTARAAAFTVELLRKVYGFDESAQLLLTEE